MSKMFADCENEEERVFLRDEYLEMIYHKLIIQNGAMENIKERLRRIEDKLDLLASKRMDEVYGVSSESIYKLFGE